VALSKAGKWHLPAKATEFRMVFAKIIVFGSKKGHNEIEGAQIRFFGQSKRASQR
jgi:hypothetical protein